MTTAKPRIIFLMGPTAAGKTDLAIGLREQLPVELISVDSALVYRGLDIGSAKPSAAELAQAPHRLIDICDPAEPYSAADFRAAALAEIAAIHGAGRIPLLVGGTMLYFKALLEGMADLPVADAAIRQQIEADACAHGWPFVHAQLTLVDPTAAARIHPHHSQRISRALEVYRASGETMSQLWERQDRTGQNLNQRFNVVQFGLMPHNRALLHRRIEARFLRMLDAGLLEEVARLQQRPDLHQDLPAIRAVGYRQAWEYLAGNIDRATMVERGIVATRQLAKRQLTWLRGWPQLQRVYIDNPGLEIPEIDNPEVQLRKKSDLIQEIMNYLKQTPL